MSKSKGKDDTLDSLSNRDAVDVPDDLSLSDSDPEESLETFSRKIEDLSSSSEEEENTKQAHTVPQGKPAFKLSGGSSGFTNRSRSIFDQLDSAAKLTSNQLSDDNVLDGTFARPAPPSPPPSAQGKFRGTKKVSSAKRVPDYLAHPERWTCYSLDDVPETSDKKNSQVAHEFIQGLQERRRSLEATEEAFTPAFNQDHSSSSEHKIVFTRPSQASRDESQTAQKVERAKRNEVGLLHLDAGQEEEEGEKVASLHHKSMSVKEEARKRKRVPEEEGDGVQGKASNVAFNSGKKTNRKNFRKAVEDEEED